MPFNIVENNIAHVEADAVVNAANTHLAEGTGVCGAIFSGAGREQMKQACANIGFCATGSSVVTPAFNLPAHWVIHAVGPIWQGGEHNEEAALRSCYQSIFKQVIDLEAKSVAFPLISTGVYGFPAELALDVVREETQQFLNNHDDIQVTLVLFERSTLKVARNLSTELAEFIDENYVEDFAKVVRRKAVLHSETAAYRAIVSGADFEKATPGQLEELLDNLDAGFSETLLNIIDQKNLTDAEVYKRANLSRQLFSKIRNNPDYRPTKPTALALAMALELDVEDTCDLLERAGLTLSNTSKFDVIVRFFIENEMFDIYRLNEVLFTYDQPLVGSF